MKNDEVASSSITVPYDYSYQPGIDQGHFMACRAVVSPLMEKYGNNYCDEAYHGDCSIGGQYQPALPTQQHFHGHEQLQGALEHHAVACKCHYCLDEGKGASSV